MDRAGVDARIKGGEDVKLRVLLVGETVDSQPVGNNYEARDL